MRSWIAMIAVVFSLGCIERRVPLADPPERFDWNVADAARDWADPDPAPPEPAPPEPSPPEPAPPEPESPVVEAGMTWQLSARYAAIGAVEVGCADCDPYDGDTRCDQALPLLCFEPGNASPPAGLPPADQYREWSGGRVQMTADRFAPAQDGLERIADANAQCADAFGPAWRLASFHDGWGWNFRAFGDLPGVEIGTRFWVDIRDQRTGTCWAR